MLKKLSDEEEARLRREELRQHGLSRRKSLSTKEVAKTLSARVCGRFRSSSRPKRRVRRVVGEAGYGRGSGLGQCPWRRGVGGLAELARKSAGGDSGRDSTGTRTRSSWTCLHSNKLLVLISCVERGFE